MADFVRARVPAWAAWPEGRVEEVLGHAHACGCLHTTAEHGQLTGVVVAWPVTAERPDDEWPDPVPPAEAAWLRVDLWLATTLRSKAEFALGYLLRYGRLPIRGLRHGRRWQPDHLALARLWCRMARNMATA